jgi:hypothetical protein
VAALSRLPVAVGQHHPRLVGERAGDRHLLALASDSAVGRNPARSASPTRLHQLVARRRAAAPVSFASKARAT